jgi:hypothetical protein
MEQEEGGFVLMCCISSVSCTLSENSVAGCVISGFRRDLDEIVQFWDITQR